VKDKQALPNNKLLVFSTFRHTLSYLEERLKLESVRIGLIHGDVPEEERRELRIIFSGATIAPEHRRTRCASIFSHWDERWSMSIRSDPENLNPRPCGRTRFANRRTDRLPPDVWILLNGAAR
jgi:hypothetical protein